MTPILAHPRKFLYSETLLALVAGGLAALAGCAPPEPALAGPLMASPSESAP